MGFDINGVRFLLAARASGVSFQRVATIGRQGLHLPAHELRQTLDRFGWQVDETQAQALFGGDGFAEGLLRLLGAEAVCSLDASAYEGATQLQDMNLPVPAELRGAFSVVIDSGSLEHIFNFPQALRNCMEMAQVGGHLLLLTPANNFMGHGFYQFSPEVFFSALAADNGYRIERMLLYESLPNTTWYKVAAPERVQRRVELLNSFHAHLLVQARRVEERPVLAAAPQQSDYVAEWQSREGAAGAGAKPRPLSWIRRLERRAPYRLARMYFALRSIFRDPLRDRQFYEPVSLEQLVAGQL